MADGILYTSDGTNLINIGANSVNVSAQYTWTNTQTFSNTITFSGVGFGTVTAASNTDLTKHIALYSTTYGFNVTASTLNYNSGSAHVFRAAGTEYLRANTIGTTVNGYFGVGASAVAGRTVNLGKTITGAATSYGIYGGGTVNTDVITTAYGFYSTPTMTAQGTISNIIDFASAGAALPANSYATNKYSYVSSAASYGINNYGFYSNMGATYTATINNVAVTSLVATITTAAVHNIPVGQTVAITGLTNSVLNGTYVVTACPTTTTFTFTTASGDIASVTDSGTVTIGVANNRYNLYMQGSASNYLNGNTAIGSVSNIPYTKFSVTGTNLAVGITNPGSLGNTVAVPNGYFGTGNNNGGAFYFGVTTFANSSSPTGGVEAGWQGTTNPSIAIGTLRGDNRNYMIQDYGGRTYFNYQTTQLATTLVSGVQYTILSNSASSNSTDFTQFGAADSNPGTVFTATISGNAASGNGAAIPSAIGANTRLFIAANGNVGIANNNPADKLSVNGTVNATSHTVGATFTANSTGVYTTGVVNSASHTVGTAFTANSSMTNTVSLVVSTNVATIGTAAYFISNGNIGIGTNTPNASLSITPSTASGTAGAVNKIRVYDDNSGSLYGLGVSTASLDIVTGYGGQINFYGGGNTPILLARIDSQGNAAFGETSDTARAAITGYAVNNAAGLYVFGGGGGGTYTDIMGANYDSWTGGAPGTIRFYDSNYSADIAFLMKTQGASTTPSNERVRFSANGNVGIGNAAPIDKLSVNGTTYFGANVKIAAGISVIDSTGSGGTIGQVLTSNGTGNVYWAAVTASINTTAQYTWSNTQTFSANQTLFTSSNAAPNAIAGAIISNGGIAANGNIYTAGRIGYANSTGANQAYTYYNATVGSLDTVFG